MNPQVTQELFVDENSFWVIYFLTYFIFYGLKIKLLDVKQFFFIIENK